LHHHGVEAWRGLRRNRHIRGKAAIGIDLYGVKQGVARIAHRDGLAWHEAETRQAGFLPGQGAGGKDPTLEIAGRGIKCGLRQNGGRSRHGKRGPHTLGRNGFTHR